MTVSVHLGQLYTSSVHYIYFCCMLQLLIGSVMQ